MAVKQKLASQQIHQMAFSYGGSSSITCECYSSNYSKVAVAIIHLIAVITSSVAAVVVVVIIVVAVVEE